MRLARVSLGALSWCLLLAVATSRGANFTAPIEDLERLLLAQPLVITQAEISRPQVKEDITLKADISFGGAAPIRVKLRHAEPGADSFNNVPRYDLAAYEVQKLFLDPPEYVVPPTALRMIAGEEYRKYQSGVAPTFPGSGQVLCVVQYWLNDIKVILDVYDAERFARDPLYARHIGQLNLLTFLIRHGDSNVGNFLIGRDEIGPRVFSIDNGVAFASEASDRGALWQGMRVKSLPADAIERLRKVTAETLQQRLGVLAQWQLEDGNFVAVAPGDNLAANRGVRIKGDVVQMGLTTAEIREVRRQLKTLLARIDHGSIKLSPAAAP
jgi:hypothetical protein